MKREDWFIKFDCNIDNFRKELWKNVPGAKKVEYAWDMVIEAMNIKGTPEKLKFQKKIKSFKN